MDAMHAAYTSRARTSTATIDIPIIDWRHYLEAELDMHNIAPVVRLAASGCSNHDGDAVEPGDLVHGRATRRGRPTRRRSAFEVMDEWMANIRAQPATRRGRQQARALAVDSLLRDARRRTIARRAPTSGTAILDYAPGGRVHRSASRLYSTIAHRRGRADRGRRLQVRAAAGGDGASPTARTAPWAPTAAERDAARADLPDGSLRLHEAGRGPAVGR